ncbi:MAG: CFAP61 family protein, partial [Candidatus Methanomethylicus sp.]|nr:CFAP61 family protein [Candidatus Methanomethylicus sp.]
MGNRQWACSRQKLKKALLLKLRKNEGLFSLLEKITIREFIQEDLDDVMTVNKVCLPENYSSAFYLEHFFENPKCFLVAEVDGKIVGYN